MYFRYSHSPEEHYLIVSARGGLDVRAYVQTYFSCQFTLSASEILSLQISHMMYIFLY